MGITELVFPTYKADPGLQAQLKNTAPEIFKQFHGTEGLLSLFRGKILVDNGVPVDLGSGRSLLVLEWDRASSFHRFYPDSAPFQKFVQLIKPFLAGPVTPELFESPARSELCSSSSVTQIIKVKKAPNTEHLWNEFHAAVANTTTGNPASFYASGVESHEGVFLGMVGWRSLEDYYQSTKNEKATGILKELGSSGKMCDIVAQLERIGV
ncbi:hypothetical protein N8I77_012172 [Diaporthe amygdali]|uniref:Uncharacterized protein n=1 Tax=Phomopsis amygdali TaxID=1214568 RepID=A0AAD9VY50_PHOAM|nr:hypothetical protein N8I77_012172 [Diaporthe amygdali]